MPAAGAVADTGLSRCLNTIIAVVVGCLFLNCPLQAREFRVAVSGEMAPFFYLENNQWQGISIEVAHILLERLGHSITLISSLPMRRLERYMFDGRVDLHPNWSPTAERLSTAVFTTVPHVIETHSFITLKNRPVPYNGTMESLRGIRIAAMQGWTHGSAFDENRELQKLFLRSVAAQVRLLVHGRVRLVIQNPGTFLAHARAEGYSAGDFSVLKPPAVQLPVHMGISRSIRNAAEIRDDLDRAIDAFTRTDEYRGLLEKYRLAP